MNQPTRFFQDYEYLRDVFADNKQKFEQENPNKQYEDAIFTITDKFLKSSPTAYLKFGPYWWAVKQILNRKGFSNYIGEDDFVIARAYTYRTEEEKADYHATLTAAWLFKDFYNENYFQGNRQFALWDNRELYELYDPYWEYQFN